MTAKIQDDIVARNSSFGMFFLNNYVFTLLCDWMPLEENTQFILIEVVATMMLPTDNSLRRIVI